MLRIIFYSKERCSLCDEALALLELLRNEFPSTLEIRDIYSNDEWLEKYHFSIPVINIDGVELDCEEISYETLEATLKEANDKRKA
ncbi:glutaredoxin family protein [Virgibacillus sp. DJP39]|uniref:glutaredoxin family protein n=1 Tax=Virgibacillus sp. DJP39 TaxID=3409790 RepID=UPI003BB64A15